jgi:hypothetical protein
MIKTPINFGGEMTANTSNYDLYVDNLMKKWAYFSEKNLTGGIGFPSRSIISKIMQYGFLIQTSFGAQQISYDNDDVEEIEKALNDLGKYNPKLAKIIMIRYLYTTHIREILARESITYDVYKKGLQIAKAWMAAALRGNVQSYRKAA